MPVLRPAIFLVPVFIILQFAAGSISAAAINYPQLLASKPAAADTVRKTVDRELIRRIIASRMASPVTKPQEFTNPFGTRSAPSEEECIASPIHFQQWTNARLETSDCVLESGQYWDVYYFEALAGEQADVHMYENWFDTVLLLADETGSWVVSDNDSGGNNAARITTKVPETGIYFVIATSFQEAATSDYNLILRGGPDCTYRLSPSSATLPPEAGSYSFTVKTGPRCYFQARTAGLYVDENSIIASGQGLGEGEITYTVTPNPRNSERHGGIGLAPYPIQANHNITQLPKVCSYTFDPGSPISLGPFESTTTFNVYTQSGCSWSAFGAFSATGGAIGNGVVQFQANQNNGPDRSGWLNIDTAKYVVNQKGLNCTYSISPTNDRLVAARGTEGLLTVETQPDCTWGLERNQNWIEVERGLFRGPKSVPFRIQPLAEQDDRSGSIQFNYSLGWESGGYSSIHFEQLPASFSTVSDLDGDGISDASVYQPGTGKWQALGSLKTVQDTSLGDAGDIAVAADYDGDGKTDPAVFTPSSGRWRILASSNEQVRELFLGAEGDIPAHEDYDGDGKADPAVYRPADSRWIIEKSISGRTEEIYGTVGSLPVPADWDKDGKADLAVFNRATSQWELSRSLNGPVNITFGSAGDYIFAASYGSGFVQPSYYRPSTGEWRVRMIPWEGEVTVDAPFVPGAVPVIGDYDGNGGVDPTLYEPASGIWHIKLLKPPTKTIVLGGTGFVPLSGRIYAPESSPTVLVSGRAVTADGRGLNNVAVTLVAADNSVRTVRTGTLGYFSFANVPTGSYTLLAISKRHRFASKDILLTDDLTDLQMTGVE